MRGDGNEITPSPMEGECRGVAAGGAIAGKLLSNYLIFGLLSLGAFVFFLCILISAIFSSRPVGMLHFFLVLLFGFLWVGLTVIGRHSFIVLNDYIGRRITTCEFISTQFVIIVLPFTYRRIRKEVGLFREKG